MKKFKFILLFPAIVFFLNSNPLFAQETIGGKVSYEQIINYNLEGVFDDPRWDAYIADLPKTGKSYHTLYFSSQEAMYEEDPSKNKPMSRELRGAIMKANYSKKPQAVVKKIYYDFEANERVEQREFMTRNFLVSTELEQKKWRLTSNKKKVQDYVCLGAEIKVGTEIITAWFTSEIPVAAGPDNYFGLPGLILGLEKNGEVFLLATSIDLTPPEKSDLNTLDKGQKLSLEKFEKIAAEKIEEYQKMMEARKKNKTKG